VSEKLPEDGPPSKRFLPEDSKQMSGVTKQQLEYEGGQTVVWNPVPNRTLVCRNQKVVPRFTSHLTPNGSKLTFKH
jgi:hypothetical protein